MKGSVLVLPLAIYAISRRRPPASRFESLPAEVLGNILLQADLFTRVSLAQCNRFFLEVAAIHGVLEFDRHALSTSDQISIVESISFHIRNPQLRKRRWSPFNVGSVLLVRNRRILDPAALECYHCDFPCIADRGEGVTASRHLMEKHPERVGLVTKSMTGLLEEGLKLVIEEQKVKLRRAAYLTLKVPTLSTVKKES